MSARLARFEVVRTPAGWHARFRAANGRIVWVTESYVKRAAANRAVDMFQRAWRRTPLEVRRVDERGAA